MERAKFAIIMLLVLALGVFVGSNFITNWIVETKGVIDDIERELILDHRSKMREILKNTSDSLLFHINNYQIDITKDKSILTLVDQYISVLKNEEFGELMLIRISPDGKILYDSYWSTLKPMGTKTRSLSNEVIPQKAVTQQINKVIGNNEYTLDDRITIYELQQIKSEYPNLYDSIDNHINYINLSNVQNIFNEIRAGNSTNAQTNYTWELKSGEEELLEWVTIPPGSLGFYDIPDSTWGIENENHKWVLIMRSDKKDILRNYENVFFEIKEKIAVTKVLYMLLIFILISSIIIISYFIAILEKK